MKRVNEILIHPQYIENLNKIALAETNREFCRHNLQHFLDVARVAYIKALERNIKLDKELIYATGLLHDIGRWRQYIDGSDHALVSSALAKEILKDCKFSRQEIEEIIRAIQKHRKGKNLITDLEKVIYEGDKESRLCIQCHKIHQCHRDIGGMGTEINY